MLFHESLKIYQLVFPELNEAPFEPDLPLENNELPPDPLPDRPALTAKFKDWKQKSHKEDETKLLIVEEKLFVTKAIAMLSLCEGKQDNNWACGLQQALSSV